MINKDIKDAKIEFNEKTNKKYRAANELTALTIDNMDFTVGNK